jgi:hypothetical protein
MKLWSLNLLMLFLGFSVIFTSCTGDGTTPTIDQGPTVSLEAGSGLISSDATVNVGEEFSVSVKGSKTDNDMKTLTIEEAGTKITLERISLASNPALLTGTEVTTFTKNIKVKAHTTVGEKTYSFIVEDVDGNKTSKSIKITTKGTPPSVTLNGNNTIVVGTDALYAANFKIAPGTSKLATIEVLVNDVTYDKAKCFYGDPNSVTFTANPFPIPAADQNGFENKILVRTPNTAGTYKVTYKFTDATGLSTSQVITVITGSAIDMLEGVLLNQAGPSGTGGLDLDTGSGTGSANADAEIRDMGIDAALPPATNWKQRIAGVNGAEVKTMKKGSNGLPETFSFANVAVKEELAGLFNLGTPFTATDGSFKVSEKIAIGDVFIVKKGNTYYLLETKAVVVKPGDNSDSYTFDVKK